MSDRALPTPAEIELRQDEVLARLDELNRLIEQALTEASAADAARR